MKKSNVVLIVVLVLLLGVAWFSSLTSLASSSKERRTLIQQAQQYSEKELYQKAIACYDNLLEQKEDKEIRILWMEAHKNAFLDGAIELRPYAEAIRYMCDKYPKESTYWEMLISTYLENGEMQNAYNSYVRCRKLGTVNETISKYGREIMYTFSVYGISYTEYYCNADGYYSVNSGTHWGVLDGTGDRVFDTIYEYISPYNNTNEALYVADGDQRIIDEKTVVQHKIDVEYTRTGAYSDGILPVCISDNVWRYLDCQTNSYLNGEYEYASNYMNGTAAICKNGKWMLVNREGEQISDTVFSDIKLHSNGDYSYDGIMVAAEKGEYSFYNENGEKLTDFQAKEMDVYVGGPVAFADNSSKWGFVNKDGKVALKAQFTKAKSFSNNLAAVSDGSQWGFVDKDGNVVIEHQFLEAGYFTKQGTCMISMQEGFYNLLYLKFQEK